MRNLLALLINHYRHYTKYYERTYYYKSPLRRGNEWLNVSQSQLYSSRYHAIKDLAFHDCYGKARPGYRSPE
jgi:hypothetical protein